MKEFKNEKIKELGADASRRNVLLASILSFFHSFIFSFFHLFILSFFHFFISSCAETSTFESPIPAYNVQYSCNISTINAAMGQSDLPNLDSQPGVVMINQHRSQSDVIGVCGLLLYHAATENAFYAYDLACPYCYQHGMQRQAITMRDAFTAQCPSCKSEFGAVQYGSPAPTAGPANKENLHLRTYHARMANYSTLVVSR